jgi:hypothetical protein
MHTAPQGAERTLTDHKKWVCLTYSTRNAPLLEQEYELILAHDPQLVAIPRFHGRGHTKPGVGTLPYRGGHPGGIAVADSVLLPRLHCRQNVVKRAWRPF